MAVSTGGGICEANGLLNDELVMYNAKVERAPDTWMVEPNPVDGLDVRTTDGITAGYQFAEGAHKNGSTFITVDYTIGCGYFSELAFVRFAASVPDSQFEANTARCVILGKGADAPNDMSLDCHSFADIGFHTTAYFRLDVS
jgi:hypothetical protein